jgi:hypothetical protein
MRSWTVCDVAAMIMTFADGEGSVFLVGPAPSSQRCVDH